MIPRKYSWAWLKLEWKYWRLRWWARWNAREEIRRLRISRDNILNDLVKAEQNLGLCNHWTLRPPFLPCPHPECYSSQKEVYRVDIDTAPLRFPSNFEEPFEETRQQSFWEIGRVACDEGPQEYWGWFPISGWPPKAEEKK